MSRRAYGGALIRSRLTLIGGLLVALSSCSARKDAAAERPSARCAGCHDQDFRAATHPPHQGVRPSTCATCHSETAWHPSRLVHSFALDGAHAKATCFECHRGATPTFEGTTKLCADCHQHNRQTADSKVEHHSNFPSECQTCHTTTAWKPTLPHEVPAADEPPEEPAAPEASPHSDPKGVAKPGTKTKAPAGPNTTWKPSSKKPDQVTGASRTKKAPATAP